MGDGSPSLARGALQRICVGRLGHGRSRNPPVPDRQIRPRLAHGPNAGGGAGPTRVADPADWRRRRALGRWPQARARDFHEIELNCREHCRGRGVVA